MLAKAGRPATAGTGITTMTPATAEVPATFGGFRNVNSSTKYIGNSSRTMDVNSRMQKVHTQKSFRLNTFCTQ
jgi:hypothetical protein